MEAALRDYILAAPGLSGLDGRVWWLTRPQGTALPAIVLHVIDDVPIYSDEGESGLVQSRVQADVWGLAAGGMEALRTVAAHLMLRLSGLRTTTGGVEFQAIYADSRRDSFEDGEGGDRFFRISIDFIIWHKEA